jgi:hypothetical protein
MRSRKRAKQSATNYGAISMIGVCVLAFIGLGAGLVLDDYVEMDTQFCLGGGASGTAIFADYSGGWGEDAMQQKGMVEYFKLLYERLDGNERFVIYGSTKQEFSDMPPEKFAICRPVRTPEESTKYGGREFAEPFLAKLNRKAYRKQYRPHVEDMLDPNISDEDAMPYSPILEYMAGMSRLPEMTGKDIGRMVIMSDLLQNSPKGGRFCEVKGNMPSFDTYRQRPKWNAVAPDPFTGIDIEILLFERNLKGSFCTQIELENWWRDYFMQNGAKSVRYIRLSQGV